MMYVYMAGPFLAMSEYASNIPKGMDYLELTEAEYSSMVPNDGKDYSFTIDYKSRTITATPMVPAIDVRTTKLSDLSAAGNAAIVAGVAVTLPSTGKVEHFALHETDQINLTAALTTVDMGAAGYPYHADGQLCRLYPAQDILAISQAAITHKLYHTTYCNHLLVWARRAETAEELAGITYGAELPEDLADNLAAVLAAAGGVADA